MATNPILAALKTFSTTSGTLKEKATAAKSSAEAAQPAHTESVAAKKSAIDVLQQQILSQNTSDKWSGQGLGSAEANARDMAKILAGIGITDIRQFGQFEATVDKKQTAYPEYQTIDVGDGTQSVPTGRYYIPEYTQVGDGEQLTGKTYVDPAYVEQSTSVNGDSESTTYTATIPTKQLVYGNKLTGQAVPTTYSERQTGNAWGGTFAGDGNTGYRVDFAPNGTPIFYTTGASSSDVANLMPLISIGLGLALPGAGAAIGAALGAGTGAAATALGNAVIGGVMAEAQGGDFLKGALTSAAGSALGGVVRPELVELTGSNALANSLTSGAISELSGGNFLQGAIQGGISGLTQDAKLSLADQYIDAVEPGIGYNPATSPTELDVIQAYPELAPPSDNFSQGVTDILNYAANAPSVQLAAGTNYVGEFSGMEYDPNQGVYRLEIAGTNNDAINPEEYLDSVEPGIGYDDLTSPTEQDLLDAFPELAQNNQDFYIPPQVFDTPQSVQNVVDTISADVSVANPSLTADEVRSIVEGSISNLPPGLSAEDVRTIVTDSLTNLPAAPTQQDIIDIIGGQNFATPDDIRTAISGIQFPENMTPEDVQNIVSEAFQNNPGITATDVQDIVQGALNNLPPGLSSDDVRNIVTDAVSNIPAAPTEQDIINIIGGQGLATGQDLGNLANQFDLTQQELVNQIGNVQTGLETQLNQQGKDFMDYLQQQGFDYETSLTEALEAQRNEFGTALNQTTEDLLNQLSSTGSGLQTQFETGLQGLADQLGITQQELINQLNQTQESFGSELSNLQTKLTDFDTTNAERYADLIKTVGLVGTGLGALQSTFNLFKDQNTPKQFEVVAPPSEWTSPVYGTPTTTPVPFTPSAPINFGSPELLQGTQFARPAAQPFQMPYDLSNVVNTLNFQSVPFVQQPMAQSFTGLANQPTAGVNNIIGNLNGAPVSIADIISNIQGQYGQKAAS